MQRSVFLSCKFAQLFTEYLFFVAFHLNLLSFFFRVCVFAHIRVSFSNRTRLQKDLHVCGNEQNVNEPNSTAILKCSNSNVNNSSSGDLTFFFAHVLGQQSNTTNCMTCSQISRFCENWILFCQLFVGISEIIFSMENVFLQRATKKCQNRFIVVTLNTHRDMILAPQKKNN